MTQGQIIKTSRVPTIQKKKSTYYCTLLSPQYKNIGCWPLLIIIVVIWDRVHTDCSYPRPDHVEPWNPGSCSELRQESMNNLLTVKVNETVEQPIESESRLSFCECSVLNQVVQSTVTPAAPQLCSMSCFTCFTKQTYSKWQILCVASL